MNEVKDLELEVVDLGDATDVTMGLTQGIPSEANPAAPFVKPE